MNLTSIVFGAGEPPLPQKKTDAWNKHCLQAADAVGRVEMIGADVPFSARDWPPGIQHPAAAFTGLLQLISCR